MASRWNWTADHPDKFFVDVAIAAKQLGCGTVFDLLGPMFYESGCRAAARNDDTDASGLIQLLPANLPGVGWTKSPDEFRRLSSVDQLTYNARFLRPYAPLTTVASVYCAIFAPAHLAKASTPEAVLYAKDATSLRRSAAYTLNSNLDADGDERIQVRELVQAVKRACAGKRWAEIVLRTGDRAPAWLTPDPTDLSSPIGLQYGLKRLGYDPGMLDGMIGPATEKAVRAFQKAADLDVDGRAGPKTRGAMRGALSSMI